jgi:hypothetical protein
MILATGLLKWRASALVNPIEASIRERLQTIPSEFSVLKEVSLSYVRYCSMRDTDETININADTDYYSEHGEGWASFEKLVRG